MDIELLNAEQIYKIFWDKYLIQTSNIDRINSSQKKIILFKYIFDLFMKFIFKDFLCIFSILFLYLSYFFYGNIKLNNQSIFLYSHKSQLKGLNFKLLNLRVNLLPVVKSRITSNHIYKLLSHEEFLIVLIFSIFNYPILLFQIYKICKKNKVNPYFYFLINSLNISSILELNLLFKSISKIKNNEIYCSAQFCPHLNLLSTYKLLNTKSKWKLNLLQHGVYEIDRFDRPYKKIYADKFFYKYSQSINWLTKNYIFNKDCNYIKKFDNKINSLITQRKKKKVIAYASSGYFDRDKLILRKLNQLTSKNKNIFFLFYPHPQYINVSSKFIKDFNYIRLFKTRRHKNIDLLITGYSSIGLDYMAIKVNTIFVPFDDSICAFMDNDIEIENINTLNERVIKVLGLDN